MTIALVYIYICMYVIIAKCPFAFHVLYCRRNVYHVKNNGKDSFTASLKVRKIPNSHM